MIESKVLFAAERGDKESAYKAGVYFYEQANYETAAYYMKTAADKGYLPAILTLAELYFFGIGVKTDRKRAKKLYRRAAGLDCAEAWAQLADCIDEKTALGARKKTRYFKRAAKCNCPEGQFGLGISYLKGSGVKKNIEKARYYLTLAARSGSAPAIFELRDRVFDV